MRSTEVQVRERAGDALLRWRHDTVAFVREVFGVEPDRWQLKAMRRFDRYDRSALKSCKGPGKTCVLAWCIWSFFATRPHANVAVTSVSGDNLKDGLWKELAKWQLKSPWLLDSFEWQVTRIVSKQYPATWWVSARQWSKSADLQAQSATLAGLHADYMLFVADEVSNIPMPVMVTAEAALANAGMDGHEAKLLMAGNPLQCAGPLWEACTTHSKQWKVTEVTADPNDPDRTPRVSRKWAKQQIKMFGRDNPWVLVNVFGKFPPASINALLGPDEVRNAMRLNLKPEDYTFAQKRLGIDVARFGDDRTVIFPRQGLAAFPPIVLRGQRTTDIAGRVQAVKLHWGSELEIIDDTGHWGHGVIDNLHAAGYAPIGVQFHGPPNDPRFKNRRAEGWIKMAEWVRRGGALPQVDELVAEMTSPTYTFVNGVFVLEPKDLIKQRLGTSPDLADALALTFMVPELPSSEGLPASVIQRRHALKVEYDPFSEEAFAR